MQVSAISIIEELKAKLLQFPALVDGLKNKDSDFLPKLETWMKETEAILKQYRITECATVAGYRSRILVPLYAERQQRPAKKQQLQLASEILFDLQQTLVAVLKPYELKVNEARDLMVYMLSVVHQSGAMKYTDTTVFQEFLSGIWQLSANHEQLKPLVSKILSLVSPVDALRIMAEEIRINEWK